jgi:hypothetical protein
MVINLHEWNDAVINAKQFYRKSNNNSSTGINEWFRTQGCSVRVIRGQVVYRFYLKKKYTWFLLKWS